MTTIFINGDKWTWNVLSVEKYNLKHANDLPSTSICDEIKREIDFKENNFNIDTILHEVTHAYQLYICLENVEKLDPDDYIEIYATFMEKYGLKIVETSFNIYCKYLEEDNIKSQWKRIKKQLTL